MTAKQQRFCEEYLIDLNATRAAIRAGYSPNSAKTNGPRLLENAGVRARVEAMMARLSRRTGVSAERVVRELARVAFASMPDEPDTADILQQALAESKRLLLPRVLSRTEMDWVEITALSQLQPGAYGILEAPASLPAFDTAHLGDGALALIPCLAASPDGVRLGRGGGYYDRFLAHYKGKRLLVCPTAALLGDLPCEGWDVRFSPHEILTEKGILL